MGTDKKPIILHDFSSFCRIVALILVSIFAAIGLALASSLPSSGSIFSVEKAYAETVNVDYHYKVRYGEAGGKTGFYTASGYTAFCLEPWAPRANLDAYFNINQVYNRDMIAIMYYGYGGPGFSTAKKTMWPSTYYNGAAWTSNLYYAMTHVLITEAYGQADPMYGMTWSFSEWVRSSLWPTYYAMVGAYDSIPQWFKNSVYTFNEGGYDQDMIMFKYQKAGGIRILKKESGTNKKMAGAKFTIYTSNSSGKKGSKVMTITTDSDGIAQTGKNDLLTGYYYVSETKVPSGHQAVADFVVRVKNDLSWNSDGKTITKYDMPLVSKTVKKVWYGTHKGASCTVELLRGNSVYATKALNSSNSYKATFTNLPKYNSKGKEIVYSVREKGVSNNVVTLKDTSGTSRKYRSVVSGFTIKNIELVSKEGIKTWNDSNNRYSTRPSSLVLELYRNNKLVSSKTVTEATSWKTTWTDLPSTDDSGNTYTYRVAEKSDSVNANKSYSYSAKSDNKTVVNTLKTTTFTVTKNFVRSTMSLPSSVTVKVQRNGEDLSPATTATLNADNGWKYTFSGLPLCDAQGNNYHYSAVEVSNSSPGDWNVIYNSQGDVITNISTETTEIPVRKLWDDFNNKWGVRPQSITVQLYRNGQALQGHQATLSAANNWQTVFSGADLYKFDPTTGELQAYSVEEVSPQEGYRMTCAGNSELGYVVTNHITKVKLHAVKAWDDDNNAGGHRPSSVNVHILRNGQVLDGVVLTLTEQDGWEVESGFLDRYDAQGNEYTYELRELDSDVPLYYYPTYSGHWKSTLTFTNVDNRIDIPVTKQWSDYDDLFSTRPASISVELLCNGEQMSPRRTATLTAASNWSYTFTEVPEYSYSDTTGTVTKNVYSVVEAVPTHYAVQYSGDAENGFVIGNDLVDIKVTANKVWSNDELDTSHRTSEVTVSILADGVLTGDTITIRESQGWTAQSGFLPKYDATGREIRYSLLESNVPYGYAAYYTQLDQPYHTAVVNLKIKNDVDVSVVKEWNDNNDAEGLRPNSVEATISAHAYTDTHVWNKVQLDLSDSAITPAPPRAAAAAPAANTLSLAPASVPVQMASAVSTAAQTLAVDLPEQPSLLSSLSSYDVGELPAQIALPAQRDWFPVYPDSNAQEYEYRLLVDADAVSETDGKLLGSSDDVALVGYESVNEMREAQASLVAVGIQATQDTEVSIASEQEAESGKMAFSAYDNPFSRAEAADAPADDDGIVVALIDTGVCEDPHVIARYSVIGDVLDDDNGHGTDMLNAMLAKNSHVKVISIKALDADGIGTVSSICAAVEQARELGADIINLSVAGRAGAANSALASVVGKALDDGILVVAAAGNGGVDASSVTPANVPGVFTVGASHDGIPSEDSNFGECVDAYLDAPSTSVAAAMASGILSGNGLDTAKLNDHPIPELSPEEREKRDLEFSYYKGLLPEDGRLMIASTSSEASYAGGDCKLRVSWQESNANTTYAVTPIVQRYDSYYTNDTGSFSVTVKLGSTQKSSGSGSWGTGSGWRNVKTMPKLSVTKTTSAQTITVTVSTDYLFSTIKSSGFYSIGTQTATFTIKVPALTSYTIKYNAGGGSSTPSNQTKYYGKALTLRGAISHASSSPGNYTVTLNGNGATNPSALSSKRTVTYKFNKWKASDGTTYAASGSYTKNAGTTMTATWTTTETRAAVKLPSISFSGYTFNGWYTAASGGTRVGGAGDSYTPTGNVTLYAQWNRTVTFNANGGSGAPSAQSSLRSNAITLSSTQPTRAGYTFLRWNTNADGTGTNYNAGASYPANQPSVTLYAQWQLDAYSIAYAGMDGATFGASHPTEANVDATFTVNNPTRPSFEFVGWDITNMDSSTHTYGGVTTTATSISRTKATSFKNLRASPGTVLFTAVWSGAYAVFDEDTGTLTFDRYVGSTPPPSGTTGNLTYYYGIEDSDSPLADNAPWLEYDQEIEQVVFASTISPQSTAHWFDGCSNLTSITGLNTLDTSDVVYANSMFEGCASLTTLDVSSFELLSVEDMSRMFADCPRLTRIYALAATDWSGVYADNEDMFSGDVSLLGGNWTAYDAAVVDQSLARTDNLSDRAGYFTDLTGELYAFVSRLHSGRTYTADFYMAYDSLTAASATLELYDRATQRLLASVPFQAGTGAQHYMIDGLTVGGSNNGTFVDVVIVPKISNVNQTEHVINTSMYGFGLSYSKENSIDMLAPTPAEVSDPATCTHDHVSQPFTISYCLGVDEMECGCEDEQTAIACSDCGSVKILSCVQVCGDCGESMSDWDPYLNIWLDPNVTSHGLTDLSYISHYPAYQAAFSPTSPVDTPLLSISPLSVQLDGSNNWSYEWPDLPLYTNDSYPIVYTVDESAVPEGYRKTVLGNADDGFRIVNTFLDVHLDIAANKVWRDAENAGGFRPQSVMARLLRDGQPMSPDQTVVLNAQNGWSASFDNLDRYRTLRPDGNYTEADEYNYTVEEVNVPDGYSLTMTGTKDTGFTLTNTADFVEVPVQKTWHDNEDEQGVRPQSVTVKLYADGVYTGKTVQLSAQNNWRDSFRNLKRANNGQPIAYTVEEDMGQSASAYESRIVSSGGGYELVNTVKYRNIPVSKTWTDKDGVPISASERAGKQAVSVGLYRDSDNVLVASVQLSESNGWASTFSNVPMADANGNEIAYSIREINAPSGYKEKPSGDKWSGYSIENRYNRVSVEVDKVWDDDSNALGYRPSSLHVELLADGASVGIEHDIVPVDVVERDAFGNVRLAENPELSVAPDGEVVYSVDNTTAYDNEYMPYPYVTLSADGTPAPDSGWHASMVQSWHYVFENLPVENDAGEPILYTAVETVPAHYALVGVTGSAAEGFVFENRIDVVDVPVRKVWENVSDDPNEMARGQMMPQPDDVTVILLADGEDISRYAILNGENNWQTVFSALPKYTELGVEIDYTVTEVPTEGFETVTSGNAENGYVITNIAKLRIPVQKIWNDKDDHDGNRPASITVRLLSNGQPTDKSIVLTEENEWAGAFENIPMYDQSGVKIEYSVAEDAIPEDAASHGVYTAEYSGDTLGFTVKNDYEPRYTEFKVKKVWDDADDSDALRPEAIAVDLVQNNVTSPPYKTMILDAACGWEGVFEKVLIYDGAGTDVENSYQIIERIPTPAEMTAYYAPDEGDEPGDDPSEPDPSYVIDEHALDEYTQHISGSQETGFVATNSHEPAYTSISVTKRWEDDNNALNIRPASIPVALRCYEDDTIEFTADLTEADGWTYTFTHLPIYDEINGIEYTYYVEETLPAPAGDDQPHYIQTDLQGNAQIGFTLTNALVGEPPDLYLDVVKVWNGENANYPVPSTITYSVQRDGQTLAGYENLVLRAADGWVATNLGPFPRRDNATGREYVYSVKEASVAGYQAATHRSNDELVIENTPRRKISVTKDWNDNDDILGSRPGSVTFHLMNRLYMSSAPASYDEDLALYALGTNRNEEFVLEGRLTGARTMNVKFYGQSASTGDVEEIGSIHVTTAADGSFECPTLYASTQYVAYFANLLVDTGEAAIAQSEVSALFTRAAQPGVAVYAEGIASQSNNWHCEWDNLPIYDLAGHEIEYWVEENDVAGYELTQMEETAADTFVAHNRLLDSISVQKVWDDGGAVSSRPAQITVWLVRDGVRIASKTVTAESNWACEFDGLAWRASNGDEYRYTVEEEPVEGYSISVTGSAADGFTITNGVDYTEVPVDKVWNDNNNSEGLRPASVTMGLFGEDVYSATLAKRESPDVLSDKWSGLAARYNERYATFGSQAVRLNYTFTLDDDPDSDGADLRLALLDSSGTELAHADIEALPGQSVGGSLPLDSYTPAVLASSRLVLSSPDEGDRIFDSLFEDGLMSAGISISYRDSYGTVALNAGNSWHNVFRNLRQFDGGGNPINYMVGEVAVDGYISSVSGSLSEGYTVTNSRAARDIEVRKAWDDGNDVDGDRPDSVTVNLLRDSVVYQTAVLDEKGGWAHTFEDLPQFAADGHAWAYTVSENTVEGYTTAVSGSVENGFTITNTHDTEYTNIDVTKTWYGLYEGNAPESVVFRLYQNNDDEPYSIETHAVSPEEKTFSFKFENLPKYDDEGVAYTYSVVEEPVEHFVTVCTGDAAHGFQISNSYTSPYTPTRASTAVAKVWHDPGYEDDRPSYIDFILYQDGDEIDRISVDELSDYSGSFDDLPKYDPIDDHEYEYEIVEAMPARFAGVYSTEVEGDIDEGFTVTNTRREEIEFDKVWCDGDDAAHLRPSEIMVTLIGETTANTIVYTQRVTGPSWHADFPVNQTDSDGEVYTWRISEAPVQGYTSDVQGNAEDGFVAYNTLLRDIEVNKTWQDQNNDFGTRPAQIQLRLYMPDDIQEGPYRTATVTSQQGNTWHYTFEDVPAYDGDDWIEYRLEELPVKDYAVQVTETAGGSFAVTNTLQTFEIPVTKNWVDLNNANGNRPAGLSFSLSLADPAQASTVDMTNVNRTLSLGASDGWQGAFRGLPAYDSNSQPVAYIVTENLTSTHYLLTAQTGSMASGFTFSNTELNELTVRKQVTDASNTGYTVSGQTYSFVLTLTDIGGTPLAGAFTAEDSSGRTFTVANGSTFTISDEGSVTIHNLPVNTLYSVTEVSFPSGTSLASSTNTSGALGHSAQVTATFVNAYNPYIDVPMTGSDDGLRLMALRMLGLVAVVCGAAWVAFSTRRRRIDSVTRHLS